ncbi:MAG: hypothetical protein ACREL9_05940 [Gemmatimonadales bacterium]
MGLWSGTLVYVGARTLLAAAIVLYVLRRQAGVWVLAGQVVSDLCCAAFLLGYINVDSREDIGLLAVPLWVFVVYWEISRRRGWLARQREETDGPDDSALASASRIYRGLWVVGFVAPAVVAGGFLVFDLVSPR